MQGQSFTKRENKLKSRYARLRGRYRFASRPFCFEEGEMRKGQEETIKALKDVFLFGSFPLSSNQQQPSRGPDGPRAATFFDALPGQLRRGREPSVFAVSSVINIARKSPEGLGIEAGKPG